MKIRTIRIENLPDMTNRATWSKLTGVPVTTLMREEDRGRLNPTRMGYNVFYTKKEVIRWLEAHGKRFATIHEC